MPRTTSRRNSLILLLLAVLLGLGGLQVWSALATREVVDRALRAEAPGGVADLEREKARQELIGKVIENNSKALLQTNLVSALGAGLGVIISVSGGLIALFGYFDAREKERVDRLEADAKARADRLDAETKARDDRLQAEDKARRDRLAAALGDTLGRLASGDSRQRAVGAAGLLPFFAPDRVEFHLQALAALIALAKSPDEPADVREGVRVALERAVRTVHPQVLRTLSWRRVQLSQINFRDCDLVGLDLSDAVLTNAVLDGAKLNLADLTAAKLQGASMVKAKLANANLTYADLAGANLQGAVLRGAAIDNIGVLNVDLAGAELQSLASGWRGVPWDATRNWRRASFDADVRAALGRVYGEEVPPHKVLMLLWEVPPFVAGGTWTAAYHLVRKLRRRGADLTIVTPWRRDLLSDNPFGPDVPIVGLGVIPPRNAGPGGYGAYSSYGSYSSYSSYSSYGGALGSYGGYGLQGLAGSVLAALIEEYRVRLLAFLAEQSFDLIHAHDWVTFGAAEAAAGALARPWIAHFHSTEYDRNPDAADPLTAAIERGAVQRAFAAVTPSAVTRRRLVSAYGAAEDRVVVVPNVLTAEPVSAEDIGSPDARTAVFVGRLAPQKGFDRFATMAERARSPYGGVRYEAVGEGAYDAARPYVRLRGWLPWERRGEAFRDAGVIVMPSRAEPFGMVVLEAMLHRTPILYPADSGAAEVLQSGFKVDPADIDGMTRLVARLLADGGLWETTVRAQAAEIDDYLGRPYEQPLVDLWSRAAPAAAAAPRP
jgi:glycosyltransferase involved in cell wall biosynthesis